MKTNQKAKDQELENLRAIVQEKELLARLNKAEYDRMDYFIKAHEIEGRFIEVNSERQKKYEEFKANQLLEQIKENDPELKAELSTTEG